ncbi:YdgA family protein [Desulfocurvibacter africanus]|uniref:YdgA family protein n=1 Tax=Desulfocurvibacter africanus TaxID=873 RepID=UPI00047F5531|nr:YdgA family protein [Desulfocurvibacter africanus]
MRKHLYVLAGAAGVAALYVALAWFMGAQAEQKYQALLEPVVTQSGLELVHEGYERGVLTSTARTRVVLPYPADPKATREAGAAGAPERVSLLLESTIIHGPLPFRQPEGRLVLKPVQAIIESKLVHEPASVIPQELDIRSVAVVGALGGITVSTSVLPVEIALPGGQGTRVFWKGMEQELRLSRDMVELEIEARGEGLEIGDADVRLAVGPFSLTGECRRSEEGLYVGEMQGKLDNMTMGAGQDNSSIDFKMAELDVAMRDSAENGLLAIEYALSAKTVHAGDWDAGPLSLTMIMRNFDIALIRQYQASFQEMQLKAGAISEEEQQKLLLDSLDGLLPGLLRPSPEFALKDLVLRTPHGDLTGLFKVAVHGETVQENITPAQVPMLLDIKADAAVDEGLFLALAERFIKPQLVEAGAEPEVVDDAAKQSALQTLDSLAAQGVLLREDGHVRSGFTIKNGVIAVNGKPIPISLSGQ